jgi:hypothetical protein
MAPASSAFRWAQGKAHGALAFHGGFARPWSHAGRTATFITDAVHAVGGAGLVPVAGGVLIRSAAGEMLLAEGISADNSDSDEACASAVIMAASLAGEEPLVPASQPSQPLMLALYSAFFFVLKPCVDLPTCVPLASDFARQRNSKRLSLWIDVQFVVSHF